MNQGLGGALYGVRVVELSRGVSASAVTGRLLAELGATVVKLEVREGDPLRRNYPEAPDGLAYVFHMLHVNKHSVCYGDASASSIDWLSRFLRWADVAITDCWGLAALREAGVEVRSLEAQFPHLIVCSVTPFGLGGPLASWQAGELAVQCTSGIASTTGLPGGRPTRVGVSLGAFAGGILSAAAVIAALFARASSGWGQLIDMAVHDCLLFLLGSTHAPVYFLTGRRPGPQGNRHPMAAPWNAYQTRDGWVQICTMSDAQWNALLDLMGRQDLREDRELATVEGRVRGVDRVDQLLSGWCRGLTTKDLLERLSAAHVPAGPIADVTQLLSNAHFRERNMIVELRAQDGSILRVPGSVFKLSRTPGRVLSLAPYLGEGNEEFVDLSERSAPDASGRPTAAPLEGIRVVEMGMHTAAPLAGRLLASLGAEVIKVEPPTGEPARRLALKIAGKESYLYQMNNTDKLSVCLDLSRERDRVLLLELLRCSDVFIENFAPGVTDKWGIGPSLVETANPSLVYCAVTGFGHTGPLRDTRAYDTIIQAMSGLMQLTGGAGTPLKAGASVADQLGACVATVAVLAALWWRQGSGLGQLVDVSMHDVCGWLTMEAWPAALASNCSLGRSGVHGESRLSGIYECKDGFVALEVQDSTDWRKVVEATGLARRGCPQPAYGTGAACGADRDELETLVSGWVKGRTVGEVVAGLQTAGVCAVPVMGLDEVLSHPHTSFRNMVRTVEVPGVGPVRVLGIPLGLTKSPPQVKRGAPGLCQHGEKVFAELVGSARAG